MSVQAGSIMSLLLEDPGREIPVVITQEFDVEICVRGYHFYNHQPNIGEKVVAFPDDDPMSLIHDRYAIAIKTVGTGRKIGHVPKFMSRFTYYFLRHGGVVNGTILGEKQYSWDLEQGGLQGILLIRGQILEANQRQGFEQLWRPTRDQILDNFGGQFGVPKNTINPQKVKKNSESSIGGKST